MSQLLLQYIDIKRITALFLSITLPFSLAGAAQATTKPTSELIYNPGTLKPIDSVLKVKAGDMAPDFTLPSLGDTEIRLSSFQGKKNVVLSFIPAAWTPVCSDQWPGYNIARKYFEANDAVLLGISVDNLPTLYAWTHQMGELWFDILSDFWPHGEVADSYGLLRSGGTAERAMVYIDKEGIISAITVSDINERPELEEIVKQLEKLGNTAN